MMLAQRLPNELLGSAADLAHQAPALKREAILALDPQVDDGPANVLDREMFVEQPNERPDRAGRVIVLGLAQKQRATALEITKVDVVAKSRAADLAFAVHGEH